MDFMRSTAWLTWQHSGFTSIVNNRENQIAASPAKSACHSCNNKFESIDSSRRPKSGAQFYHPCATACVEPACCALSS
jgi:hypothetical protein